MSLQFAGRSTEMRVKGLCLSTPEAKCQRLDLRPLFL
jgi:hypothetical protein